MKDKKKPIGNKELRREIYDILGVETPAKSIFRAVSTIIPLRQPNDIARIIQKSGGSSKLKPAKVAEMLKEWYPSKEERDSRFPINARKIFFPDEFPSETLLKSEPEEKQGAEKKVKRKTRPKVRFTTMEGFNPERPFRASVVTKQLSSTASGPLAESAEKPVSVVASGLFTPEFIKLMIERVPAAQHFAFRKFVFEKRREKRSAAQWIEIWNISNTRDTQHTSREPSEKLVHRAETANLTLVKINAEGSMRTIYQRDTSAQAQFKSRLVAIWDGKCAIEGVELSGVLEAAHISHGSDFSDDNGILMTPTMHALFDRHLIGIEPVTLILHVSPALPELKRLHGIQLHPPLQLNLAGLRKRWELYLQTNSSMKPTGKK